MSLPDTYISGFHDEESVRRMEYNGILGRTGMKLSKISYGGGPLSSLYGELDVDEAICTIRKSIKSGINYIDTAPFYGQGRSEEVLGLALKEVPRKAYYIATKVGRYGKNFDDMFDFSADKTRESVEKSLKLLGLEYIDLIQIHDIEFAESLDIIVNETLPELEKLVKDGKAKFIGLTGYPLSRLKQCVQLVPGRFDTVLTYCRNTLLDVALSAYLDFFKSENLGVICASAHAMGLLTNSGPQNWHPASDDIKQLCRSAVAVCKENNIELARLAMYYSMQLPGPATFLTGMQTRCLLDMNLDVHFNGITEKEHFLLQHLRETIFTQSHNWEGFELEKYTTTMKRLNK